MTSEEKTRTLVVVVSEPYGSQFFPTGALVHLPAPLCAQPRGSNGLPPWQHFLWPTSMHTCYLESSQALRRSTFRHSCSSSSFSSLRHPNKIKLIEEINHRLATTSNLEFSLHKISFCRFNNGQKNRVLTSQAILNLITKKDNSCSYCSSLVNLQGMEQSLTNK